jgi:predicted regulator of Ras-like GTPase activity (Roadblock/LC7/MglB family)
MFKDALKEIVDNSDRAIGALIMDASGIALESYANDAAKVDITMVGVEFSVVLGSARRAASMLEAGSTDEMLVETQNFTAVFRCLGDNYFVALALEPHAHVGKGRYALRLAAPKIAAEL